jgi:hypothetical protein
MFYDLFALLSTDLPFEGAKAVNWIHEDFDERSTYVYYLLLLKPERYA